MADKQDDEKEDLRFEFIFGYLSKTSKLRMDKWNKMMSNADFKKIIVTFFNVPDEKMLIIQISGSGLLQPYLRIPTGDKNKLTYFYKREPVQITVNNYRDVLIPGDMSSKPIDDLAILTDKAYLPMLSNVNNHQGWPNVVAEDVTKHVHEFRNSICELKSKMSGRTYLPMPMGVEKIFSQRLSLIEGDGEDDIDFQFLSNIENVVMKWNSQINEVLKEDSTIVFVNNKNPLPSEEFEFWKERLYNLEYIYIQLSDPRVKRIALYLEALESRYLLFLRTSIENVVQGIVEAKDIYIHLKPVEYYINELNKADFHDAFSSLKRIIHCVCIVWANSRHFCCSTRLINFLKELVNLLIEMNTTYLDPSSLLQGDIEDNLIRINDVMKLLDDFVEMFEDFRGRVETYFKQPVEPVPWTFHRKLIFERLYLFQKRLEEIKTLLDIAKEYLKLEKIDLKGLQGKTLMNNVNQIYEDFFKMFTELSSGEYEILTPEDEGFSTELNHLLEKVNEYDRQLAKIFDIAFTNCDTLESMFQLIWIIGGLTFRPLIGSQLKHQFTTVANKIHQQLESDKVIFDKNVESFQKTGRMIIDPYFPPIAGALFLLMKLKDKSRNVMKMLETLNHPFLNSQSIEDAHAKYDQFMEMLTSTEEQIRKEWTETVSTVYHKYFFVPLFKVMGEAEERKLEPNIHPDLLNILEEVRYTNIVNKADLSEEISYLLSNSYHLNKCFYNAALIVNYYKGLRENLYPHEYELIKEEIEAIDQIVDDGQANLKWNSPEIDGYLVNLAKIVRKLYYRLDRAKANLNEIIDSMKSWTMEPILQRRDRKKEHTLITVDVHKYLQKRYDTIQKVNEKLTYMLEDNYMWIFGLYPQSKYDTDSIKDDEETEQTSENVEAKDDEEEILVTAEDEEQEEIEETMEIVIPEEDIDQDSPEMSEEEKVLEAERREKWKPYLKFVDNLIFEQLTQAVLTSMCYFLDETDPEENVWPLFDIDMDLNVYDGIIIFNPNLSVNDENGFFAYYLQIIDSISKMGEFINHIDPDSERDTYELDLQENERFIFMKEETKDRIRNALIEVDKFSLEFDKYSWIWTSTSAVQKNRFDSQIDFNVDFKKMNLKDIRNKFEDYNILYKECELIDDEKVVSQIFRINAKPFKQTLLLKVDTLIEQLKNSTRVAIIKDINVNHELLTTAYETFAKVVDKGDYLTLVNKIKYLKEVRDKHFNIVDDIANLKVKLNFMNEFNIFIEPTDVKKILDMPELWINVQKMAVQEKQLVSPFLEYYTGLLKKRMNYFDFRTLQFLNKFHKDEIFNYEIQQIYEKLDTFYNEIYEFDKQLSAIKEEAEIFEQPVSEFHHFQQVKRELKLLKCLWDYVFVIQTSLNEWKTTVWENIDVEGMDQECKNSIKELRLLDKEVRSWDLYSYVESQVKNMMSSLRAVSELQNPAIKSRHWMQLMAETKVRFTMDSKTTLEDLLKLELHKYEEEVKNMVDKAVKEMAMEKALVEITNIWNNLEFELEYHERTKLNLLKVSEETIETLEDHQVQLLNMLSSKFVGHFLDTITSWQLKLKNADTVITAWFDVQISWKNLESIFIGSEDIRKQLPNDSKRFDEIDRQFKELLSLKEMTQSSNIVKTTNRPKLLERLYFLLEQLNLCEKALTDYLETKRLAYPRFYFVSAADLIDILSNGNNPKLVCRHLGKLYDSLADLRWKVEKTANAMVAKDGEVMQMHGTCDCTGKVEDWLNRVTNAMRKTVKYHFNQAIITYTGKQRDQWIFDYEAQPALCGTQIWWTTEVKDSFTRLEEGFENAMKDYQKKQISQLNALIDLLIGDLSANNRQKIMTICTIDVHARDVVATLINTKAESASSFQWQSQLKHGWDNKKEDCYVTICDASFSYSYEYLGNVPRLVITPLTDRCYITLTQSLHLVMGGAPAGPAGTGKTETTKDLGKALGQMVYVFNCSEQMDYKSCANIYKGLAQTGAWGCFDEFNRISVEVLSVVAVQVKQVLDGVKSRKKTFTFFGEELNLVKTVGMFITMNPGYLGRTELPENLKTLFRPCAMVVPDFALICEIMLVAEGFQEARLLARKFITLYTLCRELLSKQDHYDWGLRAIKSVLVIAGKLKREDRLRPENQVLMRALRDFNISKIITDDVAVFMGLIEDLFPALNIPRKRDLEFEKTVRNAATDLKLQPEDGFVLKVVQLEELLFVRHSVFIVGFAGTGKTQVWKTLFRTYFNQGRKPHYNDLDPKAVTTDELFGIMNPATREWKDGLVSVLMRDQANMTGDGPKWIVFDGDIDPMWIESLNTVMDDNKVLTLASNERIALTKQMRLIFEISNLRTATPATVSRAGILYINPQDLGWNPYVASWIDSRHHFERAYLTLLFDKYVAPVLEVIKVKFKKIIPIPEICHVEMLCRLLDCLLTKENVPPECPKEWYEIYFVFACVWAFGSCTFKDQLIDWRNEFNKWWQSEFKTIKFPSYGTVFNYYVDPETKKFVPWKELVEPFTLDREIPLQFTMIPTGETVCLQYFMELLMQKNIPVMLVGAGGSGKTVLVSDQLSKLPDNYIVVNVPFNYYTTSEMLQRILEKRLEKKIGRNYGPPGNKKLVYFIDDMNMPKVDQYGTVQPHTIIRQHLNYSHWYDRSKLTLKEICNTQYISCMNPTAGSFTIDSRLQRHFAVFAVSFPEREATTTIYRQILSQHLLDPVQKIKSNVQALTDQILNTALFLHEKVTMKFLPTAIKFHYTFNLRDLTNIFQTILFANADAMPTPNDLIRLYIHEATRVYCDKLVDNEDKQEYNKLLQEALRKNIETLDEKVFEEPNIFCHFAQGVGEPKYMPITSTKRLSNLIKEAQRNYRDLVAEMDLIMFKDALHHVCRINRILESPQGNALLVGVGGSGKQSLARLASFISSLQVFQVQLRKGYSINDLKSDLSTLYQRAGLKNVGITFLMTDSQVAEEEFLVVINDMLATGEIVDLFADDEREDIINSVKPEVLMSGLMDTKENCWKFFIRKVMRQLKCVLCFSPVGATLRQRARKFPALVNCTSIDWFQDWPSDALLFVSSVLLRPVEDLPPEHQETVARFMMHVHVTVNETSKVYLENEKKYNYTTPKTYLEQINLYSMLLKKLMNKGRERIQRLKNGLTKLVSCSDQANALKVVLAVQEIELKAKNEIADQILAELRVENTKAEKEKEFVTVEEAKVAEIKEEVEKKQKRCDEDLAQAEPAVRQAEAALNTLNKNNLTELKALVQPPAPVVKVAEAVYVLFSLKGKIPKDRSWKACKAMMGGLDTFLSNLKKYDKENIHPEVVKAIQPYINDKEFEPDFIYSKSQAAAGLCSWVKNIMAFHYINEPVKPLRAALAQANAELKAAMDKLNNLRNRLKEIQIILDSLSERMNVALAEKQRCQDEANATALSINLANRLVNGLASEKVRWEKEATDLEQAEITMPGDVLLLTAFISYVGCFTKKYRNELNNNWTAFLNGLKKPIPRTPDMDPISMLVDDAKIAEWNNEGLPGDRMSTENAMILLTSTRWPLMIDPQLQGIKWVKNKYGDQLTVLRLTQRNYMDQLEIAISNGNVVLIENILESVDPVMDPILGRVLIKKGRVIKIGDKEVDYDPKFRLILHSKLANPHYKPEMQAQTTLINFTVTRDGLEEQLLEEALKIELEDMAQQRLQLTTDQNNYKIRIKELEDKLLQRLSSASGDILSDVELVTDLEEMKQVCSDVEKMIEAAMHAKEEINAAREDYRLAASQSSIAYFVISDLYKINMMYQFSLKLFLVTFKEAISGYAEINPLNSRNDHRISLLTKHIIYCIYMQSSVGLFERDKLTFLCHLTIQILLHKGLIPSDELDFLLRYPYKPNVTSPVEFLNDVNWGGILYLSDLDEFRNLSNDIEGAAKRWQSFVNAEAPEKEKLPQEWKNKTTFQKLCIMRCLRVDRMTYAIRTLIKETLDIQTMEIPLAGLDYWLTKIDKMIPLFFILSPGIDPLKDVEYFGKKNGFTTINGKLHNISLGQGQEVVAEAAMQLAGEMGHWVILQNIHLVQKWLPKLERLIETIGENAHDDYKLFISAEPSSDPHLSVIPQGILESCSKITNEPPTGIKANVIKALSNFSQQTLDNCTKETEFKAILFALCYYHAVVAERRKFGPQGWNKVYPFNFGDLTISVQVLSNYLENNNKVPWEDLRYLFGEIMYGGHITDDWDRRLCRTYLSVYLRPELIDGDFHLAPDFISPTINDFKDYFVYVENYMPDENPTLYGLHSNAEIGVMTNIAESLFQTIFELQPKDTSASDGAGISHEAKVHGIIEDLLDKIPDELNIAEFMSRVEEQTPYVIVAFQECDRMNTLCNEIKRSLNELDLGLKGELTINSDMEDLQNSLFLDAVPHTWARLAYPSTYGLTVWFADVLNRATELSNWSSDFNLPPTVWLGGFFNPQSFLTAIMQQTARKNEWPLDKMCLHCDVTKKQKEDFKGPPREGAYINGLNLEGAKWEINLGALADSKPKELFSSMPIVLIKAIAQDKVDLRNMYECPVYRTRMRGSTFVWTFNLKTRDRSSKWTLAGVAIILQI